MSKRAESRLENVSCQRFITLSQAPGKNLIRKLFIEVFLQNGCGCRLLHGLDGGGLVRLGCDGRLGSNVDCRLHPMMPVNLEKLPVPTHAILDELGNAGDSRSARARVLGHLTVAQAFGQLLGDLEALAPGLELAQRRDIAQEICHVVFILVREHGAAERSEPGLLAEAVVGEALAGGHKIIAGEVYRSLYTQYCSVHLHSPDHHGKPRR
jgi:hypothetical protein